MVPPMKSPDHHGQKLPNPLEMLSYPGWSFSQVAELQHGFGRLFLWLAIELVLLRPLSVTGALLQMKNSLGGGLHQLWNLYLHFALGPGLVIFLTGVAFYYYLRARGLRRLDIYPAASVLAQAWIPHVGWVAIGTFLVFAGYPHPLLPNSSYQHPDLTPAMTGLKGLLEFGPVVLYGFIGARAASRGGPPPWRPIASRREWCLGLITFLLFVGCAQKITRHVQTHWDSVRPVMVQDPLPPFSLSSLEGTSISNEALKDKVVLMDFWATWCGPCVASMPHLNKLYQDYRNQRVGFVSVNTEPDNLSAVREFKKERKLSFPIYVDTGALQNTMKIATYPTIVIADRFGKVRHIHMGSTSMVTLRKELDILLRE